jgi:hypothetical protein
MTHGNKVVISQGGPGMMEVNRLTDDVKVLKERMSKNRDVNTTNPFIQLMIINSFFYIFIKFPLKRKGYL